jgi:hypothetical protein
MVERRSNLKGERSRDLQGSSTEASILEKREKIEMGS